jgi:hypothetical protein
MSPKTPSSLAFAGLMALGAQLSHAQEIPTAQLSDSGRVSTVSADKVALIMDARRLEQSVATSDLETPKKATLELVRAQFPVAIQVGELKLDFNAADLDALSLQETEDGKQRIVHGKIKEITNSPIVVNERGAIENQEILIEFSLAAWLAHDLSLGKVGKLLQKLKDGKHYTIIQIGDVLHLEEKDS